MYWTEQPSQPDKITVSAAFDRVNSLPLSNSHFYNPNTETINYIIDFNNQAINQTSYQYTYLVEFNNKGNLKYSQDIVINLKNMNQQDVDYIRNNRINIVATFNSNNQERVESNFKVYINGVLYDGK